MGRPTSEMSMYIAESSNAQGIIQGNLDVPLNEQGEVEARLLADGLKGVPFVEARTSHLKRARRTAEVVVQLHTGLELYADPGMRERQLGSLEGKRWNPSKGIPDDAEKSGAFRQRVQSWAKEFFASHVQVGSPDSPDEPIILCMSHGAYLSTLLGVLMSGPFNFEAGPEVDLKKHCLNTSLMRVRAVYIKERKRWEGEILSWGEVGHLGGIEQKLTIADDVRQALRKTMAQA